MALPPRGRTIQFAENDIIPLPRTRENGTEAGGCRSLIWMSAGEDWFLIVVSQKDPPLRFRALVVGWPDRWIRRKNRQRPESPNDTASRQNNPRA